MNNKTAPKCEYHPGETMVFQSEDDDCITYACPLPNCFYTKTIR